MPSPAAVAAVFATRAYLTTVARVSRLSAHFVRVTVTGSLLSTSVPLP
ncbi:hypothetical protein [Nesterenkonia pannonica]|nr:hypothetical protein [Nesterenkonia pannonica]